MPEKKNVPPPLPPEAPPLEQIAAEYLSSTHHIIETATGELLAYRRIDIAKEKDDAISK